MADATVASETVQKLILSDQRVILHIDLDSYYAQVEQRRLGIPKDVPLAVQQWEGLIAVNYAARDRGITRHMRLAEALSKCPELVLVHVETLGGGAEGDGSGAASERAASGDEVQAAPVDAAADEPPSSSEAAHQASHQHLRLTQKACLERYRRANAEILALLHRIAPAAVMEKASIDEVYLDVTAMVDIELQAQPGDTSDAFNALEGGGSDAAAAFAWGSIVMGGAPLDPGSEFDRRLAAGAGVACRLRGGIARELGLTSSAGISNNKLLAKIGSAMHKPNQQTLIPPRAAAAVLADLPLKRVKNFGGKLGQQLEGLGCVTAGDVQRLPLEVLRRHFGAERAAGIAQAVRGYSGEAVEEKERPKSMLAAKSFNSTSDLAALERWIKLLASELALRMAADSATYRRRPRTLVVHYRAGPGPERSRRCAMPSAAAADAIASAAWALFQARCMADALPCTRLTVSAADFVDLAVGSGSSLTRFLVPRKAAGAPDASEAAAAAGGGQEVCDAGKAAAEPGSGREEKRSAARVDALLERLAGDQRISPPPPPQQQMQREEAQPALPAIRHSPAAGSAEGAPPAPSDDAAEAACGVVVPDSVLLGVDIAQQRRLLKEAEMWQALNRGRSTASQAAGTGNGKRRKKGSSSGAPQQEGIARFFGSGASGSGTSKS